MKRIYSYLGLVMSLLVVQSCFVAKDYQAPENVINEESYRTDRIATDSLSMAEFSWKEIFTDPLLQNHIEKALSNNIDIRIALEQIGIAEAYAKQGRLGLLPSVNGNLNYTRNYPSKNGPQGQSIAKRGDHVNLYSLGGNLSWEADIWGKITSQKNAFEAGYLRSVAAHQFVKTELIAGIATAYYQLLAIDEQIEVTQKTIETRRSSLETTKALKEAGAGNMTSLAVQQTEAQLLEAQALLINLQKEARLLENTISILLGDEPHEIQRGDLQSQNVSTDYKVGVPVHLLSNRPDVMAAEAGYRQAFEMTNVSKAELYPSLTIGLNGGLESLEINKWFKRNSISGGLLGGITAPIFNGRALKTQHEVAQLQQEQALLDYRNTLIRASKEVSDAIYNYQASSDKIEIKKAQQVLLEQAVEDSQALLESGYNNFSYLEVLSAQENVLNVSLDVIRESVTQMNSVVELYRSLGGGWR